MNKCIFLLRIYAVLAKEVIQLLRDKITFLIILLLPILQIILFSSVINTNPRNLSTAVIDWDQTNISRSIIHGLINTNYFAVNLFTHNEQLTENLLVHNKLKVIITIPAKFSRNLIRGNKPTILIQADNTNSVEIANAIQAAIQLPETVLENDLPNITKDVTNKQTSNKLFNFIIEPKFNPASIPEYLTTPGLIATMITLAMLLMILISVTREKEFNTLEHILTSQATAFEVITGKVIPYIFISLFLLLISIIICHTLFKVPIYGDILDLFISSIFFVLATLFSGLLISTVATNQKQATHLASFYYFPNLLFSGFAFPFYGMPKWAQLIGNILPITHYIRILKGILLKGPKYNIWPETIPIIIFAAVLLTLTFISFRRAYKGVSA